MQRRRLLERLQLLCNCGVGLEAIAGPACAVARELVGADASSIFWRDRYGEPAGFYHENAPAELKDLFVTRFEEIFSDPSEFNMVTMTEVAGPSIGQILSDEAQVRFLESNVYKYLCQPLGHEHCLDVRIDVGGRGVAVMALWGLADQRFTWHDAEAIKPVQALLQEAAASQQADSHWRSSGGKTAHFITDIRGHSLLAINEEAEALLTSGHLLRQHLPIAREVRVAPSFSLQLAAMLRQNLKAELYLPVANGRIAATASRSKALLPDGQTQEQMFVLVDRQFSVAVAAVEKVSALPLTLLQKRIALFAMQGGTRGDCEERFATSPAALKKHVKAIYDACEVSSWHQLYHEPVQSFPD